MSKKADCLAEMSTDSLGMEVPVKQIDSALREFFAADEGIARASLMNLAIYSESVDKVGKNTEIIQELTRENACRALLIVSQPEGNREVHAWVQAHCNINSGGEKAVCSEQVSFLLCGSSADLVRNIVFTHLDTDLPLIFWWQGELSEVFEDRLYSRIDRLIVDSRSWADPAAQFLRLVAAVDDHNASYVMHDLAYTQSNQLREAVAICFDDPAALKEVKILSEAEICFSEGHQMTAIWLAAWLAHRLGAELNTGQSGSGCYIFERQGKASGGIKIRLVADEVSRAADNFLTPISRVSLWVGNEGARFDITRYSDGQSSALWSLKRAMPGRPETSDLWPIRSFGDVGLVSEILRRAGRNRVMDELLPLVRALLAI